MGRNKMNFIDLCRGEFGRKIAYTGVSQITTANVRKVVSDTIGTHNRNRVLRTMHWKLSASKHHRHMANLSSMYARRKKLQKKQMSR